jgi:hypothetical protein
MEITESQLHLISFEAVVTHSTMEEALDNLIRKGLSEGTKAAIGAVANLKTPAAVPVAAVSEPEPEPKGEEEHPTGKQPEGEGEGEPEEQPEKLRPIKPRFAAEGVKPLDNAVPLAKAIYDLTGEPFAIYDADLKIFEALPHKNLLADGISAFDSRGTMEGIVKETGYSKGFVDPRLKQLQKLGAVDFMKLRPKDGRKTRQVWYRKITLF